MSPFKKASDIKVGCIGYGGVGENGMGRNHLTEMVAAGMTPVAVCELNPERLALAQRQFPGITPYTDVADMLKKSDVNLLAVITPHSLHAPLAIQCLKAGRHAVCEKPMACTTAECDAMIAEAKKRKLVVSTYHNRHWDGQIRETLAHVEKGQIGDIVRVECRFPSGYNKPGETWRSSMSMSGGILYDWGVHLIEWALQVIKSEIVEVSGFSHSGFWGNQTSWKKDGIEDEATAVVRFKSGCLLTLRISNLDANERSNLLEVIGTKGQYHFDWMGWYFTTHPKAGETLFLKGRNPGNQSEKFYQNIADHLVKGTPLVITGEFARRPIHILDLAVQSAKLSKALPAKYK
ncbi:MAG: Gfo/Idh/MocA family oxidoreductase [Kiritimatiellaeota bacterium]|nr:Gfo/Idh/MocA family oxidoreductase [Kiritimatiellota bacterium]